MAVLVSMGGIVFGYDTGQISGFLEMQNFEDNFGNTQPSGFSVVRSGLIVGMLSIGTLIGALIAAPIANTRLLGRKYSVCLWAVVFDVGVIIQITSIGPHWCQLMIGRIIAGLGIGALSVIVPMYQGESAPDHNRGAVVCCYQLFITIGILIAYLINFGTEGIRSAASWRIVMGIGFVWSTVLGVGILFFPETPRWDYRKGRLDSAKATIAKFHGVSDGHKVVRRQMAEMHEKLEFENMAQHPWYEVFIGPRMPYRVPLGMIILGLQQLTGANYFFYYGTTVFSSVGINNSFVTQIILGAVNVVTTFPGLWFVEKFGRRKPLIIGAAWMCMCFLVFASIGQFKLVNADGTNNQGAGYVMIVFACLFIASVSFPGVHTVPYANHRSSSHQPGAQWHGLLPRRSTQAATDLKQSRSAQDQTGSSTSSSHSSLPSSARISISRTATSLQAAISSLCSSSTSSSQKLLVVHLKKLIRSSYWR